MSEEAIISNSAQVEFDESIFSLDDIKKASYRLTDRGSFGVELNAGKILCTVFSKDNTQLSALIHDFRNEVLDQNLRASIAEKTEPLRNLILAHTFSNTGLTDE